MKNHRSFICKRRLLVILLDLLECVLTDERGQATVNQQTYLCLQGNIVSCLCNECKHQCQVRLGENNTVSRYIVYFPGMSFSRCSDKLMLIYLTVRFPTNIPPSCQNRLRKRLLSITPPKYHDSFAALHLISDEAP